MRKEMEKALPRDFNGQIWVQIVNRFGGHCALTDSHNFVVDHFIPLSWGHGGTNFRNVIPLDHDLNEDKSDQNPFTWFRSRQNALSQDKWEALIFYLSIQNDMTTDEFRAFVDWCERNKRTASEVKRDRRDSVEIWRSSCHG